MRILLLIFILLSTKLFPINFDCDSYLDFLKNVKTEKNIPDSILEISNNYYSNGNCNKALEFLIDWQVAIEYGDEDINDLEKENTISRTYTHSISVKTDYYYSQEDIGLADSIDEFIIDGNTYTDTIYGYDALDDTPFRSGIEYTFKTENRNSFINEYFTQLSVFNDYLGLRSSLDFQRHFFKDNIVTNFDFSVFAKNDNLNDSISYLFFEFSPSINGIINELISYDFSWNSDYRFYKIQKSSYENYLKNFAALDINFDFSLGSILFTGNKGNKDYLSEEFYNKNYSEYGILLSANLYLFEFLDIEASVEKEDLNYENLIVGLKSSNSITYILSNNLNFDNFNVSLNYQNNFNNNNQKDSISYFVVIDSLEQSLDTLLSSISFVSSNIVSLDINYDINNKITIALNTGFDIVLVDNNIDKNFLDYIVLLYDEYNSINLGFNLSVDLTSLNFSTSIQAEQYFYKNTDELFLDGNNNSFSLRLDGDCSWYIKKNFKLITYFDFPLPILVSENTSLDKMFMLELNYDFKY